MQSIPRNLAGALLRARSIAVLTGAGISAESGIPTFRDAQTGLWARFRPEELATAAAFRRNPKLVWDWYQWRRGLVADAAPSAGHAALARLETLVPELTLITQNVEGLHEKAGSRRLVELHGSLHRTICFEREGRINRGCTPGPEAPKCTQCGGYARPDVVWFGESLDPERLAAAQAAAKRCDMFLSIGTSSLVQPAASLPLAALEGGATLVEINPDPTPLSRAAMFSLRGPAGEILPALIEAAFP